MIKRYRYVYENSLKGPWHNGFPSPEELALVAPQDRFVGLEWEHAPDKCGATSRVEVDGSFLKCENTPCDNGTHTVWYETHDSYGSVDYLEITWHDKEHEA